MPRASTPVVWQNRIVGLTNEPPESLRKNPKNWRTHPEAQSAALRGVLGQLGWIGAVLKNDTTGNLIDGHDRMENAIATQQPTVPVLHVQLSQAEEDLALATYDPLSAMAGQDDAMLTALLADLSVTDAGLAAMLRDLAPDVPKALHEDDADLTPPVEPITRTGDLWLLGEHRLLCGNSTVAADVEGLMAGHKADMVFTDPPYGVDYDGGAKKRERLDGDRVGTSIYGDALPNLRIAAHDHAALYLWYADAHVAAAAAAAAGYEITAQIIWVKNNAQFVSAAKYHGKHEPCFYAHRKGHSAAWYGPNNEVTVWDVDRAQRNDMHPTQKPVELASRAILNSSRPGDLVLDLFGGSGSTLIAAEQTGRTAYLMEVDPGYCDVIVRRYETVSGRKAVRDGKAVAS